MHHCYLWQLCLIFLLGITLISGRAVYYDELDEDDDTKVLSSGMEDESDLEWKLFDILKKKDTNSDSYDSYEERKFHERSMASSTRPSHIISAHTRQALIDYIQKHFDNGWKPNLKHYIPATRFGRHRR